MISLISLIMFFMSLLKAKRPSTLTGRNVRLSDLLISFSYHYTELLELLVPILETIASEAASLGFEVNWQKTKLQA